jgi:hypothetical protein
MTQTPKRPRDLNEWAKRMVDIATGEASDHEPAPEEQGKDPAASNWPSTGTFAGWNSRTESVRQLTEAKAKT